jgi:integrase
VALFRPTYTDKKTGETKKQKVWWYEFAWNGERIRESTRVKNERTARNIEAAHRTRLAEGRMGIEQRPEAPTLRDFAPVFERAIETECKDSPATVDFYKSKLAFVLEFEPIAAARLDLIDEAMIDAYKESRVRQISKRKRLLSSASVNRELATLRRLLRLAKKRKVIASAPEVKLLDGEHEREFILSQQQEKLYLATVPEWLKNLALFMLDTGPRMKEALGLEWPNVHLQPAAGSSLGYVKIVWQTSKGGPRSRRTKSRNVPLTARVLEMLPSLGPQKAGYVFHRADGSPLYQTWVNEQHAAARKLLNLPAEFVPHTFRHTYGTRLGEAGADAFTIMKLMGHSSVTVSQRYVHPTPETLERAVERLQQLNQGNGAEVLKVPQEVPKAKNGKQPILQ